MSPNTFASLRIYRWLDGVAAWKKGGPTERVTRVGLTANPAEKRPEWLGLFGLQVSFSYLSSNDYGKAKVKVEGLDVIELT